MSLLNKILIIIAVFLGVAGCNNSGFVAPKFEDDSVSAREGWQYKWGDSSFDANGIPDWTRDSGKTPGWVNQNFPEWPSGKPSGVNNLWQRYKVGELKDEAQTLFLGVGWMLFEVYAEGRKIYSYGTMGKEGRGDFDGQTWHIVPLKQSYSNQYIYFRSYSSDDYIGVSKEAKIGTEADHIVWLFKKDLLLILLSGIYVFLGIVAILFWYANRDEASYLYFGSFAVCIGGYSFCRAPINYFLINDPIFWGNLELSMLYISPFCLVGFAGRLFSSGRYNYFDLINIPIASMFVIAFVSKLMLGMLLWDFLYAWQYLILVVSPLFALRMAIIAFRGDKEARFVFSGVVVVLASTVIDILSAQGVISDSSGIIHLAVFFLTCCMGIIIANRLVHAVSIRKNLELASSVQELLLPEKLIGDFYNFTYASFHQPYGQMAGDWMNFWTYSSIEKRLIFGDVIGKGPRAALAVAAIAAFIEDSKNIGHSMEECISNINTGLFQLFDGQLTTTLSAITMFEDGHIEVYNCGGVGWTQISKAGYNYFTMRSSVLGMDTPLRIGHELIKVSSGDLLLAFTDGVMEGNRTVARMVKGMQKLDLERMDAASIFAAIQSFNDIPANDDRSILTIRVLDPEATYKSA